MLLDQRLCAHTVLRSGAKERSYEHEKPLAVDEDCDIECRTV